MHILLLFFIGLTIAAGIAAVAGAIYLIRQRYWPLPLGIIALLVALAVLVFGLQFFWFSIPLIH